MTAEERAALRGLGCLIVLLLAVLAAVLCLCR